MSAEGNVTVEAGPTTQTLSFDPKRSYLDGTVTPGDAEVEVNGVAAPVDGGSFNVTVLPGPYRITATLSGYTDFSQNVTTTAGNATSVTILLNPLPTSSPSPSTGALSIADLVLLAGAVGAVAIGVGVVFALRRRRPPPPEP